MRGTHGWAEIDRERKREILEGIASGRATSGPSHVELDLTDRCNVACYFCNQQDVRTKDQLPLGHVRALVDELAAGGLKSVRLSGGGDPLAHRDFGQVLDHFALRGVVVDNLTTNGALLGPDIAARLVRGRAREVIFSLNASDPADYARMMQARPETFDRVLVNIRGLLAERGESAHPSVVVQFLLDRENFGHMDRMYAVARALSPDRIAIGPVLDIPNDRFDPGLVLRNEDEGAVRPFFEKVLAADRDAGLLQIFFPYPSWNEMVADIRGRLGIAPPAERFPTAPAFREENGHCFFGWYTAAVRGNGDLYPCCLLMTPDYPPLGNVSRGGFAEHWNGPAFNRLRTEMREVMLAGDGARFEPDRHGRIRRQCVEHGKCWLKNIYFRADEEFYRDLGAALEKARRKDRILGGPRRLARRARRILRAARKRV